MKTIKVSDSLYSRLKDIADKRGLSVAQFIDEALSVYLGGSSDRPIKNILTKVITLHYQSKCRKCNKELSQGDMGYYVKYEYDDGSVKSYVLCLDCYFSSSALAKHYLKKKELEAVIRGLKHEADALASEIKQLQSSRELLNVKLSLNQTLNTIKEILRNDLINIDKERLERLFDQLEEIRERLAKIETLLQTQLQSKTPHHKKTTLELNL